VQKETHQVNGILLYGGMVQPSVDGVGWHHQFRPGALQKDEASCKNTFLGCDIRSITRNICEGTREGDLFGEAFLTDDFRVRRPGKFFIALWFPSPWRAL